MIYALRRSLLGRMHSVSQQDRELGLSRTTYISVQRGGPGLSSSIATRGPALASGTPSCRLHGPCASCSTSKALNSCKKQIRQNGICPLGVSGQPQFQREPPAKLPEATPMNTPRRRRSGRAAGSATEAAWGSPQYDFSCDADAIRFVTPRVHREHRLREPGSPARRWAAAAPAQRMWRRCAASEDAVEMIMAYYGAAPDDPSSPLATATSC